MATVPIKPWDAQGRADTPDEVYRLAVQSNANLLKQLNVALAAVVAASRTTATTVPPTHFGVVGFFLATGSTITVPNCLAGDLLDVSAHVDVSLDRIAGTIQLRQETSLGTILDQQPLVNLSIGANREENIGLYLHDMRTVDAGDHAFVMVTSGGHAAVNGVRWKILQLRKLENVVAGVTTVLNNTSLIVVKDGSLTIQDDTNTLTQLQFELDLITPGQLRILHPPDASDTLAVLAFAQTLQNKTLDNTNIATLKDASFTIQATADATKQAQFVASGITVGQTRFYTLPDTNDTLVVLVLAQVLSNKTLNTTNIVTLQDSRFTLQDAVDATKQARLVLSAITAGQTRLYTLPDTSDTLVVRIFPQTLQNKTLDNTNIAILKDTNLTVQATADATRQAQFLASGITAGQLRLYTLPDANGTLVLLALAQILSNKTLDDTTVLTIKASNFILEDGTDITKKAQFLASGIATGQTRLFTLPDTSDTLVVLALAQTLSNKRITSRVVTLTDAATVTPNGDTTDLGILLSLSQPTTLANPTGTPADGQQLGLRIKSTVSRVLTFGTAYRFSTDLPAPAATTGGGKTDFLFFQWNAADSLWDYVRKNFGF